MACIVRWFFGFVTILAIQGVSSQKAAAGFQLQMNPEHYLQINPSSGRSFPVHIRCMLRDAGGMAAPLAGCAFKEYYQNMTMAFNEGPASPNYTFGRLNGRYDGEGLESGNCGIILSAFWNDGNHIVGCWVKPVAGGPWLNAVMLLLVATTAPMEFQLEPRVMIARAGSNITLNGKAENVLNRCLFNLPPATNRDYIFFDNGPPSASNSLARYHGKGLHNKECGITVINVPPDISGFVRVLVESSSPHCRSEDFTELIVATAPNDFNMTHTLTIENGTFILTAKCWARNSRPVSNITWLLDDRVIRQDSTNESPEDTGMLWNHDPQSITQRLLHRMTPEEIGEKLVCRVRHIALPLGMVDIEATNFKSKCSSPSCNARREGKEVTVILRNNSQCVRWYTPQDQSLKVTRGFSMDQTLKGLDRACAAAHFGHSLLHRGYLNVSTTRSTCQTPSLPLRMKRVDNVAYWVNGFGIPDEIANSTDDILHMGPGALARPADIGTLDVLSTRWSFASHSVDFNCTMCEMLRRADLNAPFEQDARYSDSNTRYNVHVMSRLGIPVEEVRLDLAAALGVSESSVSVLDESDSTLAAIATVVTTVPATLSFEGNVYTVPPNTLEPLTEKSPYTERLYFRVTVPDSNAALPPDDMANSTSFKMTLCDNVGACPANNMSDGQGNMFLWPQTNAGKVAIKRDAISLALTARECVWLSTHKTPTWTYPTIWEEFWDECVDNKEPPQETLHNAEALMGSLVDVPVLGKQLGQITRAVNEVLKLKESFISDNIHSTTNIIKNLDNILSNMIIDPGSDVVESLESDLAVVVSDVIQTGNTVVGVSFNKRGATNLTIIRTGDDVGDEEYDVRTILKTSVVLMNTRLVFTIFLDGKAFRSDTTNEDKVNSHVLDVILVNLSDNVSQTVFPVGSVIDISFRPVKRSSDNACAWWDFTTRNWSTDGCYLLHSTDTSFVDTCRCDHLTHFAEIITGGKGHLGQHHQNVLDILSLVGCVLSLLAISAVALTAICFPKWRRDQSNKILLHMTAAIALNVIAFLLLANVDTGKMGCIAIGVLCHYSVLSVFCWMLVLSILQLVRLLTILGAKGTPYLLLKTSLFGWGVPLVFVVVLLAIDPNLYSTETGTILTRDFCYPSGIYYTSTVFIPICLVLTFNIIVFVVILCRIYSCCCWGQQGSLSRHGLADRTLALRQLKTIVVLFFTFGLSWTFGLFANHSVVLAYMFSVLATLQGVVLFVGFVVLDNKTRGYCRAALHTTLARTDGSADQRTNDTELTRSKYSQHSQ